MILQGDIDDIDFRRRLIDNLVYKVYISDDNTYIYFNIKGGKGIEEITFEDTKSALDKENRVQTQSDPPRQKRFYLNSNRVAFSITIIKYIFVKGNPEIIFDFENLGKNIIY